MPPAMPTPGHAGVEPVPPGSLRPGRPRTRTMPCASSATSTRRRQVGSVQYTSQVWRQADAVSQLQGIPPRSSHDMCAGLTQATSGRTTKTSRSSLGSTSCSRRTTWRSRPRGLCSGNTTWTTAWTERRTGGELAWWASTAPSSTCLGVFHHLNLLCLCPEQRPPLLVHS